MKTMKKSLFLLTSILLAATLTACSDNKQAPYSEAVTAASSSGEAGAFDDMETITLRFSNMYSSTHPLSVAHQKTIDRIKEKSNGTIIIEQYTDGTLGASTTDDLNNLKVGAIDMAHVQTGELAKLYPEFKVLEMPYLYKSYDHFLKALDSDTIKEILKLTESINVECIQPLYYGARVVTTTDFPVNGPEDLKGKKLRVPNEPVALGVGERVLGARPTPMALSEVYLALQTGTVDGQENPVPTVYSSKFYEVCKFISLTRHQYNMPSIAISTVTKNRIPKEAYDFIVAEFQADAAATNEAVYNYENDMLKAMEEEGCTIVEPSNLEAFYENAKTYVEESEADGSIPAGLYQEIQDIMKE